MATAKKLTQAAKIRAYAAKRPNATIADLAHSMGIRYQAVYQVLKVKPSVKKPKKLRLTSAEVEVANKLGIPTKEYAEQIYKMAKGRKRVHTSTSNQSIIDKLPKVGDTVGGLTLTRKEQDGAYVYRWVKAEAVQEGKVAVDAPQADNVNHPAHYKVGGIETIDFIEAKGLNYHLGNVVKYITRADTKGNREEDLLKARWYLNREIAKFSKES